MKNQMTDEEMRVLLLDSVGFNEIHAILQEEFNGVVLDLYEMSVANAALSAQNQRLLVDDITRHISDAKRRAAIRIAIAILHQRNTPADKENPASMNATTPNQTGERVK